MLSLCSTVPFCLFLVIYCTLQSTFTIGESKEVYSSVFCNNFKTLFSYANTVGSSLHTMIAIVVTNDIGNNYSYKNVAIKKLM